MKSEFHNSKLESIAKDPDGWISHLKGLRLHMNEFGQKGNVSDEDFLIHILNNLPEEYDVVLNGLENRLIVTGDDALTIDLIRKKLNHRYKKIKSKKKKKLKKKVLEAYNKQYKQGCWKCGKYGHKPGDRICPENKNKNTKMKIVRKQNNINTKIKNLKDCATITVRKGI